MDYPRITLCIGFGQLLLGFLLFCGVDIAWIKNVMDTSKWVILLFVGGMAFSAYGFYRTFKPSAVNAKNVKDKILQWLNTFHVFPNEQDFAPWHFTFTVMFRGVEVFIGRPKTLSGRYISIQARAARLSNEQRAAFLNLTPPQSREFYIALALETAKARIQFNWRSIDDISVGRLIPITSQLSEFEIIEGLNEVQMSAVVISNTLTLWLSPNPNLAQLSATETAETPPALPQSSSPKNKKGKKP